MKPHFKGYKWTGLRYEQQYAKSYPYLTSLPTNWAMQRTVITARGKETSDRYDAAALSDKLWSRISCATASTPVRQKVHRLFYHEKAVTITAIYIYPETLIYLQAETNIHHLSTRLHKQMTDRWSSPGWGSQTLRIRTNPRKHHWLLQESQSQNKQTNCITLPVRRAPNEDIPWKGWVATLDRHWMIISCVVWREETN